MADLYAATAADALRVVEDHPVRIPKPDMPEPGRRRKRRHKADIHAMRRALAVPA